MRCTLCSPPSGHLEEPCSKIRSVKAKKSNIQRHSIFIIILYFLQLIDYRVEFSKWWVSEYKTVKFPSQGTVFDYYIDADTKKWMPWIDKVPKYEHDPEIPLQVSPSSVFFDFIFSSLYRLCWSIPLRPLVSVTSSTCSCLTSVR